MSITIWHIFVTEEMTWFQILTEPSITCVLQHLTLSFNLSLTLPGPSEWLLHTCRLWFWCWNDICCWTESSEVLKKTKNGFAQTFAPVICAFLKQKTPVSRLCCSLTLKRMKSFTIYRVSDWFSWCWKGSSWSFFSLRPAPKPSD